VVATLPISGTLTCQRSARVEIDALRCVIGD
jgi:hypothetical protein